MPVPSDASPYSVRPALSADLPLLRRWLRTPEVVRWWGDPDEQCALIEEDLRGTAMTQWIVSHADRPFAYAQAYEVHAWPQPHFAGLPPGTLAIDTFIGEPDMLYRGHGPKFLRLLAEHVLGTGAPGLAIDPALDNYPAWSAYRAAGFRGVRVFETQQGPIVLMEFDPRP
jgi:aminoglycoside 6'-N-acetyltransferase